MSTKLPGAFRRRLYTELQQWVAEGLVTPEQSATLSARYDLQAAMAPRIGAFTAVLYGFGALLIGGGVISLVAANISDIPDIVKVGGLLTLMVLFQGVGYYWWQGPRPALGHALLLLGAGLFGANMGLIGEIYHLDGRWYAGFGLWALACAMISYATGSVPVALLGIFAAGTNLFGSLVSGVDLWPAPVLAGFQAIPFAIFYRSRVTLFPALALFAAAMIGNGIVQENGLLTMCAWLICGALFTVAGHTLVTTDNTRPLGRVMQVSALLCILSALFFLSMLWVAGEMDHNWPALKHSGTMTALLTGLFGVLCIIWLGPVLLDKARAPREMPFLITLMTSCFAVVGALISQIDMLIWLVSALAFFSVALTAIWTGLNERLRTMYLVGILALGSRLMVFFFFMDSNLLWKALVMVVGGVLVIVVTLQYERWATRLAAQPREARP